MVAKKKKLLSKPKLVKKLDILFSQYIRQRDSDKNGNIHCITCGTVVPRKKSHACHFIERGNYLYRWDEDNVNAGCASCNTYHAERHMKIYTIWMIDRFGRDRVEEMLSNKWTVKQRKIHELREMVEKYKHKLLSFY